MGRVSLHYCTDRSCSAVFVVVNTLASTSSLDFVIPHLAMSSSPGRWSRDGASRLHVVTKSSIDKDRAAETLTSTARAWVRQTLASIPPSAANAVHHTHQQYFLCPNRMCSARCGRGRHSSSTPCLDWVVVSFQWTPPRLSAVGSMSTVIQHEVHT